MDVAIPSIDDLAWVEYVRWPAQRELRARFAQVGIARLFLVDEGEALPPGLGEAEDWIRLPAAPADIRARAERLAASMWPSTSEAPHLGTDQLLRRGTVVVRLSRIQTLLLAALLERPDVVISRSELARRVWRDTLPSPAALDAAMHRLRHRVLRAQLSIRAVRGHGFVLHVD